MFRSHPISLLQFGIFWAVAFVGAVALIRAFAKSADRAGAAKRSGLSAAAIALQAIGFAVLGVGPVRFELAWWAPSSLLCTIAVAFLGGSAIAIFIAATKAMGKNWSVVARMRSDHQLVRSGPFAIVRHPIYAALLLYLLSFGIAFGHFGQLLIAVPFYLAGAAIRIREEEKLLRAKFGDEHARYVREVPAFLPFIG